MKARSLLLIILLFIPGFTIAQNTKHNITSGKIIFDITYPDSKMDEQTMSNFPSESVMKFKNEKMRVEVAMPMGSTVVISDNNKGESTVLMNMMGNKWAMKMDKEQLQKEKAAGGKTTVKMTRESKVIAGYSCTKALVSVSANDDEKTFDVWFTNELKIKNSIASQIDGIDGFLMEFYSAQNGMNMKMTARSVEVKDIEDSEFLIPTDYENMSLEDLKKMGVKD